MSGHIKTLETLELVKRDAPDPKNRRLAQLPPEGAAALRNALST